MADFYDVHQKQLNAAEGRIRVGEIWSISLREPLGDVTSKPNYDEQVTIVGFRATKDGALEPACPVDHDSIADWKKRHRDTPLESFGLPSGLLRSWPMMETAK